MMISPDEQHPEEEEDSSAEVLVIGAGASGLTAAYDLKREGIRVKLLEANAFHGGRVRKLEDFADFPIDLGGEWIHTVGPQILDKIVDDHSVKVNVKTIPYDVKEYMSWTNGKWVVHKEDMSKDYKFVNYTWYDFFNDYIAPSVQEDTHYNCVVNRVEYSKTGGAKVTCRNGQTFRADQVIVTIPLKALQEGDVSFDPQLPPAKTRALENATFGLGVKVFFEFSERFYHETFGFAEDDKVAFGYRYFYNESFGQDTSRNILGCFIRGDPALRFVGLDEKTIGQELLRELDEAFEGKASKTYVKHYVQNWTKNEPYIRGTYSSYRKGVMPMYALQRDLDRTVFFAGEALPWDGSNWAYVHSAALSGRAAAKAITYIRNGKEPPFNYPACCARTLSAFGCAFVKRFW